MTIQIKEAIPNDAKFLAEINSQTWFNTYKNTKYWITEYIPNSEEQTQQYITKKSENIKNNPWSYFLAIDNWKVIWYANWKKHEDFNELFAIYVLPEYHKKWAWKLLIQSVFNYLWDEKDILVNVIWYNTNAINFYKNFWFQYLKDLNDVEIIDNIFVPEIQMIKYIKKEIFG